MSNIVFLNGKNEVVTDSLMVAEVFGKKHHHVLDSVKEIISKSKNGKTNFRLSYYNAGTRQYPKYELNRDGFVMLIMGFTGDKAFEFKEMYIDEFNRMEEKLKQMLTDSYLIDDPIARAEKWIKEQQEKRKR
ncbi:transcriptional regulator [Bacillus sp. JAS102]|uniref:Rha family transcriptional regulator n=1 Tax=Bacillus sp. JAS102 TaxID=2217824 RepID=UPI0011ECD6C3|nr:Rha family transcriptional regulator [Bacillus sp. JAS102]KAA0805635.1 transcriptional regulator [Bacillus sp. JAS102]